MCAKRHVFVCIAGKVEGRVITENAREENKQHRAERCAPQGVFHLCASAKLPFILSIQKTAVLQQHRALPVLREPKKAAAESSSKNYSIWISLDFGVSVDFFEDSAEDSALTNL